GRYEERRLGKRLSGELASLALGLFRDDPDAGVHGAAGWLLHRLGRGGDARRAEAALAGAAPGARRWLVNGQRQAFSVIPSPRPFALAARETTSRDFKRFLEERPAFGRGFKGNPERNRNPDSPATGVRWLEAVAYCRWLSEQEGVPEGEMCYPPLAEIEAAMERKKALALPADLLERAGYRLPTEAEWEQACRAGTTGPRPWGEADDLLKLHAWTGMDATTAPPAVGQLMPTGHGLFDMVGGAFEWCHDALPGGGRPIRGGAWAIPPSVARSSYRLPQHPNEVNPNPMVGFRVARTLPPDRGTLEDGERRFAYVPAEGDLVFFDDRNPAWTALFTLAGTGPPLHMGIVVKRLGGGMAILEAGPDDTVWVSLQEAGTRLRQFARDFPKGAVTIRRCRKALGKKESAALSRFAARQDGKRYAVLRLLAQGTLVCARHLLRPWMARTHLDRDAWFCSELAVAGATVAGLVGKEIPANTVYPADLADDRRFKLGATWHPAMTWKPSP
ncbi:MAG: SUMF1/EgtB/PvdO family nonheme iron enzyme, partial [Gemmataceae bacterium]|nr:SUMF1/EgtB/PvdO family nonheme iron enzyme [Gemmataceae bacterium]